MKIRAEAGVGEGFRKDSPIEVGDMARKLVRVFTDPEHRAYIESKGVIVGPFLRPLKKALEELDLAQQGALEEKRSKVRAARDGLHVRGEVISMRLVSLAHAVLGIAARDELRDALPKTTASGQRRQDREDKNNADKNNADRNNADKNKEKGDAAASAEPTTGPGAPTAGSNETPTP